MASIEKRERDGKRSWLARYRDPDGRQRSKSFTRKVDAQRWLTGTEHAKLTGGYVDPVRARALVGPWADQWLTGRALAPKTRERYQGIIAAHIRPKWGTTPLSEVTHASVQQWIAGLDLAPASVRKVHRVLSLILASAVADGRLVKNPASGISLPRVESAEKRYLTHAQVDRLAELVGPDWRLVVLFLAYTGVRWGEMAALRVNRLDLLRRRALIAESVTPVKGVMTWGPTKGHERREVPLPKFLARELEQHISEGKGPDDLVFTGPRGAVRRKSEAATAATPRPVRSQVFQRAALNAAAEAMGLCQPKLGPDGGQATITDKLGEVRPVWTKHLHPHELRHTAASLAIASGADVKVVQQMLGHKSATMTLDLYGHLFGDRLDVVADAMDAARITALAVV